MKKIDENASFFGVGGKHSREAGVTIIQDIDELAVMGLLEALKKYNFLKKKANEYIEYIKKEEIKKVILVDYGGFNLKFMELLKKEISDIEIYYYIPPKVWVWGEKRVEKIRKVDHIVVIFPWEVDFYKKHGIDVIYYGNPFLDIYERIEDRGDNILLLPGSRKKEVQKLLPIMLEVVEKRSNENFILKLANKEHLNWVEFQKDRYKNLEIIDNSSLSQVAKECKYAIAASGTVILELALLGVPGIVIYKIDWLSGMIGKHILKLNFVSLPNLALDKEVYRELLQGECNKENILEAMKNIDENKDYFETQISEIIRRLGGENIIEKYAQFFLEG
jgi:lipid-A-disaccharide synthase